MDSSAAGKSIPAAYPSSAASSPAVQESRVQRFLQSISAIPPSGEELYALRSSLTSKLPQVDLPNDITFLESEEIRPTDLDVYQQCGNCNTPEPVLCFQEKVQLHIMDHYLIDPVDAEDSMISSDECVEPDNKTIKSGFNGAKITVDKSDVAKENDLKAEVLLSKQTWNVQCSTPVDLVGTTVLPNEAYLETVSAEFNDSVDSDSFLNLSAAGCHHGQFVAQVAGGQCNGPGARSVSNRFVEEANWCLRGIQKHLQFDDEMAKQDAIETHATFLHTDSLIPVSSHFGNRGVSFIPVPSHFGNKEIFGNWQAGTSNRMVTSRSFQSQSESFRPDQNFGDQAIQSWCPSGVQEHQATVPAGNSPILQNYKLVKELIQTSSDRGRKKSRNTNELEGCTRCNCKKSKCLKLYCECFAAGLYCLDVCSCENCFNRHEYEDMVNDAKQQIESRNPLAFAPKVVSDAGNSPANMEEESIWTTQSSARHKRGCNCKKSMCLKKYCECFQLNVGCSYACRCEGCNNCFGKKSDSTYRRVRMRENPSQEQLDSMETWTDFIRAGTIHQSLRAGEELVETNHLTSLPHPHPGPMASTSLRACSKVPAVQILQGSSSHRASSGYPGYPHCHSSLATITRNLYESEDLSELSNDSFYDVPMKDEMHWFNLILPAALSVPHLSPHKNVKRC